MGQVAQTRPRTWVLWVVRAALVLSVLDAGVGKIASIWTGPRTGSFWWMVDAMPQVSIALLAVLICWAPQSRPEALGLNISVLIMFGVIPALMLLSWLPLVIGCLAILALVVRPREWIFSGPPPPRFGWFRR
ncbi:MAG: hypothetical protein QOF35_465 [Actinomycetota bacterium]|nr:hypothetical protein [Actinomycetota bacterium]